MRYLLDVSTLVASLWQNHVFHPRVQTWLEGKDLATCPITELGFLRVSVAAHGANLSQARLMLQSFLEKYEPTFVPCDIGPLSCQAATTGTKTTDFYLASLAEKHGLKWATLDENIKHPATYVVPA